MKILLATLHAKYVHNSLALPCLAAACADMAEVETVVREFTVNEPRDGVLRRVVEEEADLVAFSCYIWNIEQTLRIAADLKKVRPETCIVLGGPEVSYGTFELLERNRAIDCIVRGEGEATFRELVAALHRRPIAMRLHGDVNFRLLQGIAGLTCRDGSDIVATPDRAPLPDLDLIPSPYSLDLADLTKPLVYYETSRGCPFSCAFCMSSLEQGVRTYSPERIENDLRILSGHGVRTVKLVDRTFNYDARRADDIWRTILDIDRDSRYHFEIAADLLDDGNFSLLKTVPPGMFRFEIGVQSGSGTTLTRVARHSDMERLSANVRRLVAETGITVHLDLVAGLPHEDLAGFLESLQKVLDLLSLDDSVINADADSGRRDRMGCFIQVEMLKVLKGSPMRKIAADEGYLYSDTPPYRVLRTPWLTFEDINRIEAIARLLDLFVNSGRFAASLALLARTAPLATIFLRLALSGEGHDPAAGAALARHFEKLWTFGETALTGDDREMLREALCYDYCLAEYPVAGKLPRFFAGEGVHGGRSGATATVGDLAGRLGIGGGRRLRTFSRRFARDPRFPSGKNGPCELLFVYITNPGQGLDVRVLEGGDGAP
jgi:anaerobic magnesium-protoporphyrin IX monomethyl ester cyclase